MAEDKLRVTRRDVLRGAGAAAILGAVGTGGLAVAQDQGLPEGITRVGPEPTKVKLTINGKPKVLIVEPRVTLLDALRDRVGLTGTKRICDRGACGGCTVWIDGKTINSCMVLAVDCAGAKVTTIEGLAKGETLHPIQAAFIAHDALMCGFCTPGMLMTCAALCEKGGKPSEAEIRRGISGNLCRCGAYPHIITACQEVIK